MNSISEVESQRWARRLRSPPVVWLSLPVVFVAALSLWLRGAGFYSLSLAERIDHVDYALLSPNRPVGRTYGAIGLLLIICNLTYLLRRRFPHWPLGRMRSWLDAHVVTGLAASLLVAFHSAFQLRSPIAVVTASSLAITVLTGLLGRFFYRLVPRDESELAARIAALDALLPGVAEPLRSGLLRLRPSEPPLGAGVLRVACMVPRWTREAKARRRLVVQTVHDRLRGAAALDLDYAAPLAHAVARLAARDVYALLGSELLQAWRPWHRLCALTMVGCVLLHIGIALFFGYV